MLFCGKIESMNTKTNKWVWAFIVLCLISVSCKKSLEIIENKEQVTLKSVASYPIGFAVGVSNSTNSVQYWGNYDSSPYWSIIKNEASSITVENALKYANIHQNGADSYYFRGADSIVNFAVRNNIRIFGHCFVWHTSTAQDWVKNMTVADSALWEQRIKDHITVTMQRYKGKIKAWDVVNEAFRQDNGELRYNDPNPKTISNQGSYWARTLGKDYIARMYKYASEADPSALLFYNDYAHESEGVNTITNATIELVNSLKKRNIPIHGLGLQCHTSVSVDTSKLGSSLRKLAATGLLIHISELDVLVTKSSVGTALTETMNQQLKEAYKKIVLCYQKNVPPVQRFGITMWNVTDNDNWRVKKDGNLLTDYPMLFGTDYKKKLAYDGFIEALNSK